MGIYSRYAAAFLVLALISPQVFSAVRVPVIQNDEYIKQVLSRQTATTGAITTPAGYVAYFGADKVYAFSAGDSVRPTVREVKGLPNDGISFPYGPGAAYPSDPNYSPAAATKIKVKPQVVVPKSNILSALKSGLKLNPGQIATTLTVGAAVSAVGLLIDSAGNVSKIDDTPASFIPTGSQIHWPHEGVKYPSAISACQGLASKFAASTSGAVINSATIFSHRPFVDVTCAIDYSQGSYQEVFKPTIASVGTTCPAGLSLSSNSLSCVNPQPVPADDTDLNKLDPWVSQQSAEWLSGLIKDVCNGSTNPGACYSQMVDRSKGLISGPATAQGPATSKTTSTTNPDGSVSTRTETTSTKYDFQYSNNYFDVNTEKKTITTQDGQPVSETIENDNTPVEEAPDPTEQPEEPEPEYTFDDTPFPDVEPFYEQKYPDGLQGVWDQAKADIDNSNFLSFLRSFVPSFSGSCPSFGMSFAIGSMANFGTHDFQSLCYVFDFIKVILMVSAVFLARQLTFGG